MGVVTFEGSNWAKSEENFVAKLVYHRPGTGVIYTGSLWHSAILTLGLEDFYKPGTGVSVQYDQDNQEIGISARIGRKTHCFRRYPVSRGERLRLQGKEFFTNQAPEGYYVIGESTKLMPNVDFILRYYKPLR